MLTCQCHRATCCVCIASKPRCTCAHRSVHDHKALCSFSTHAITRVSALISLASPVSSTVGVYDTFISALHIWVTEHACRACALEIFTHRFTQGILATRLRSTWACWCSNSWSSGRSNCCRDFSDGGLRSDCKH